MATVLKIFGERNTNTNYFSELARLNLDVVELAGTVPRYVRLIQSLLPGDECLRDLYFEYTIEKNLGWKHRKIGGFEDFSKFQANNDMPLAVVSLTKNPYSWLLSLYRRPYHLSLKSEVSFFDFLRSEIPIRKRDNVSLDALNPIDLWNIKNNSYRRIPKIGGLNLKAEDLFIDPCSVVQLVSDTFSIDRRSPSFVNFHASTKDKEKNFQFYKDYYLNERWRVDLTVQSLDFINSRLDLDVVSYYGYELIDRL